MEAGEAVGAMLDFHACVVVSRKDGDKSLCDVVVQGKDGIGLACKSPRKVPVPSIKSDQKTGAEKKKEDRSGVDVLLSRKSPVPPQTMTTCTTPTTTATTPASPFALPPSAPFVDKAVVVAVVFVGAAVVPPGGNVVCTPNPPSVGVAVVPPTLPPTPADVVVTTTLALVGVQHSKNRVVDGSGPLYSGHPGTVVLGGARPPPQSRASQMAPVSGSMFKRGPSPHWVRTRRENSQGSARVRVAKAAARRVVGRCILGCGSDGGDGGWWWWMGEMDWGGRRE